MSVEDKGRVTPFVAPVPRPTPWLREELPVYIGPFRSNVAAFLDEFSREVELASPSPAVSLRMVELYSDRGRLPMRIYTEHVSEATAFCEQCRCIGWQGHPVCRVRYHFVLPARLDNNPWESLTPPEVLAAERRRTSGGNLPSAALPVLEDRTHLLHGLIHVNGFGHLMRMNRDCATPHELTGKQLMSLWNKLCNLLRARKISTEDVSQKDGVELRVLYPAMHGHTWYGQWGYGFARGAFNTPQDAWEEAVRYVRLAPLDSLLQDFSSGDQTVVSIVKLYRATRGEDGSQHDLQSLGELLRRMLRLCSSPREAAEVMGVPHEEPTPLLGGASAKEADARPSGTQPEEQPASSQHGGRERDEAAGASGQGSQPAPQGHAPKPDAGDPESGLHGERGRSEALPGGAGAPLGRRSEQGQASGTRDGGELRAPAEDTRISSTRRAPRTGPAEVLPEGAGSEQKGATAEPLAVAHGADGSRGTAGDTDTAAVKGQTPGSAPAEAEHSPLATRSSTRAKRGVAAARLLHSEGASGEGAPQHEGAGGGPRESGRRAKETHEAAQERPQQSKAKEHSVAEKPHAPVPGSAISDPPQGDLPQLERDFPKRWSGTRADIALEVVKKSLQAHMGKGWVPRTVIRDEAKDHIADSGLLDFLMKVVSNKRFDGLKVYRQQMPDRKALMYWIEDDPQWENGNPSGQQKGQDEGAERNSTADAAETSKPARRPTTTAGREALRRKRSREAAGHTGGQPVGKTRAQQRLPATGRHQETKEVDGGRGDPKKGPSHEHGDKGPATDTKPQTSSSADRGSWSQISVRSSRSGSGRAPTPEGWGIGLGGTRVLSLDEVLRNQRLSKRFRTLDVEDTKERDAATAAEDEENSVLTSQDRAEGAGNEAAGESGLGTAGGGGCDDAKPLLQKQEGHGGDGGPQAQGGIETVAAAAEEPARTTASGSEIKAGDEEQGAAAAMEMDSPGDTVPCARPEPEEANQVILEGGDKAEEELHPEGDPDAADKAVNDGQAPGAEDSAAGKEAAGGVGAAAYPCPRRLGPILEEKPLPPDLAAGIPGGEETAQENPEHQTGQVSTPKKEAPVLAPGQREDDPQPEGTPAKHPAGVLGSLPGTPEVPTGMALRTSKRGGAVPLTPGMELAMGRRRPKSFVSMLEGRSGGDSPPSMRSPLRAGMTMTPVHPCQAIEADLKYLYHAVLLEYKPDTRPEDRRRRGRSTSLALCKMTESLQTLRDTKLFLKDYQGELEPPWAASFMALAEEKGVTVPRGERVRLRVSAPISNGKAMQHMGEIPPEVVIMNRRSTVAELRQEAAAAFVANYLIFQNFEPEEVRGPDGKALSDRARLSRMEDGSHLWLSGRGLDDTSLSKWRHSGGCEDWLVMCRCGTKYDDGARMVACDCCGTWMHTRCNGIPDVMAVPLSFLCEGCKIKAEEEARRQKAADDAAAAAKAAEAESRQGEKQCPVEPEPEPEAASRAAQGGGAGAGGGEQGEGQHLASTEALDGAEDGRVKTEPAEAERPAVHQAQTQIEAAAGRKERPRRRQAAGKENSSQGEGQRARSSACLAGSSGLAVPAPPPANVPKQYELPKAIRQPQLQEGSRGIGSEASVEALGFLPWQEI